MGADEDHDGAPVADHERGPSHGALHRPPPDFGCSKSTRRRDAETRAALRDLWLHDARKEHASGPAFGQVAWQLMALGAPADLVRRAHESCLQEIDHAERCSALASACGVEQRLVGLVTRRS